MILYHGSNQEIDKIDLNQSRPHKDFGQGFYLTEDASQAMRMAEQKVLQLGGIPVVHAYAFDESHLYSNSLNVRYSTDTRKNGQDSSSQTGIGAQATEFTTMILLWEPLLTTKLAFNYSAT